MTPSSIIQTARQITNDNEDGYYRQQNDELVRYVNDGLREASLLAPRYFMATGNYECEQDQTEQALTFPDAQQLVSVIRIKDGKAIHLMDMQAMNHFSPNWASDDAGQAVNWGKYEGDALRFYVYPKAPASQVLEVMYVKNPNLYAIDDLILDVPQSWESALVDYVVYRSESKDDEHVNAGRSGTFYTSFKSKILGESA